MEDLLQSNLLYLYQNNRDIFDRIQIYMNGNQEKYSKLVYNADGTVNISYAFHDGVKLLYTEDGSDLVEWQQEHLHLSQGAFDVVFYGLGLSHHLVKLIELNSSLNFYIFEPEIDIFIEALKVIQIDQLLEHPQVKMLYVGDLDIDTGVFYKLVMTYSEYDKIDVIIPYYYNIDIERMKVFYKNNYRIREIEQMEYGFEKLFSTMPYRNSIRNIAHLLQSQPLTQLKDRWKGHTALIVGGGPSLERDIEYIKQHRDKLFIIAAGSSIQSLLHFGIEPDLSVSMDPGEANARVFRGKDLRNISLVYVPQIITEVIEQNFKSRYHAFFNNDVVMQYVFPEIRDEMILRSTTSVTGTAIQVAVMIGCKTVLLTGQDLSFPNNQYYASGAAHVNKDNSNKLAKESLLEVDNVFGSKNPTNKSMLATLQDIERLIDSIKGINFINTSSLGAKIKGADYRPFQEVLNEESFSKINREIPCIDKSEFSIEQYSVEEIKQRIHHVIETCEQLIEKTEGSLKLVDKIDQVVRQNPNKAMNYLAKLEVEFSEVTLHPFFKHVVTEWNIIQTKDYDRQVIKIEAEPTMIGKARLVNQIVQPYLKVLLTSFEAIKLEFEQVVVKVNENAS